MGTVTAYMDAADWVPYYFAFGVCFPPSLSSGLMFYFNATGIMHDMQGVNTANQLMASSGQPTDLGYQYISA